MARTEGSGSYAGNTDRFTGFAELYDRHRWSPPEILAEILCRYANTDRPELVVDLGCGTGLSTRYWEARAGRVVGVEPAADMLERAIAVTPAKNVEYRSGYGHETGLGDGCADIVTCSQSFHWMEPKATLAEVGRILRPGGVFCAYHYDTSVVAGIPDLDRVIDETSDRVYRIEIEHRLKDETRFYGKDGHRRSLKESGIFSLVHEIHLHSVDTTSADRIVGGFESFGALQSLRKLGVSDEELGMTELAETARRHIGGGTVPVYVSYTACMGITS